MIHTASVLSFLLLAVMNAFPGSALGESRIERTVLLDGVPSASELARLESLGESLSYRVTLTSISEDEATRLSQLPHRRELQIRIQGIPTQRETGIWRDFLKRTPVSRFLILAADQFPTEQQMDALDAMGAARLELVMGIYLSKQQALRLGRWASAAPGSRWITLSTLRFPMPLEQDVLLQIDPAIGIEFVTNLWPRYYAMDFMNRLRGPKQLIVRDIYPTQSDLVYLREIRRLERLVVETDYDPVRPAEFWSRFDALPHLGSLAWVRIDSFPSQASLEAYASLQARARERGAAEPKLVLDLRGRPLTQREQGLLAQTGVRVELR